MSYITLVRHGQANTEARDEDSYDRLSELGTQQARWLGEHLARTGEHFPRLVSGTLRRHRETAAAIGLAGHAEPQIDERFNEMEFFTLATLYRDQHGVPIPEDREDFTDHLPRLFSAWQAGEIDNTPETFEAFETRVHDALEDVGAGDGRVMVVTSGGVIGMAMRITLGLDMMGYARACLAVENTSLSRWLPLRGSLALTQFNALPHLEHPERQFARTHL
ncbi:histidine phosphatase family protein [Nioella aestuarii]|uniref:histidine phosphatase family protein n=1 Tax=Nioella aestuarii TaxID=1662864 RepID=UPI003D7FDFBD